MLQDGDETFQNLSRLSQLDPQLSLITTLGLAPALINPSADPSHNLTPSHDPTPSPNPSANPNDPIPRAYSIPRS